MPGLAFFALSWVSLQPRRSFPIRVEPGVHRDAANAANKANAAAQKRPSSSAKRGPRRPTGSQNNATTDTTLSPEVGRITRLIDALLHLIAASISVTSVVLEGHLGNHHARDMARPGHLPRISTLRADSALYWPDTGPYAGRGPRRKYGRQGDDDTLPGHDLQETTGAGPIQTRLYQAPLRPKEFAHPLNVGLIAQTKLRTQARAHVALFSRDLDLA